MNPILTLHKDKLYYFSIMIQSRNQNCICAKIALCENLNLLWHSLEVSDTWFLSLTNNLFSGALFAYQAAWLLDMFEGIYNERFYMQ